MTTEILLPALTPTMEEATLSRWLVKEGDKVTSGDVLAEIETDKAVLEIEAFEDGVILQILVPEGTEQVKVDTVLAVMGADSEEVIFTESATTTTEEDTSTSDASATTEVLLPALTPTMEGATLSRWLVKEGDKVTSGDVLAEIETDKAVLEIEAFEDGVILQILVPEGTEQVKVDTALAVMGAKVPATSADETKKASPLAKPATDTKVANQTDGVFKSRDDSQGRIFATPLARHTAAEAAIGLAEIKGSGAFERILKIDVLEAIEKRGKTLEAAPVNKVAAEPMDIPSDIPMEEVRLSNMRKLIAKRLQSSKQTIPHFYLSVDIELDRIMAMRSEFNTSADTIKLTVNDFIIRAVALALREVPEANVQYSDDKLIYFKRADISLAVSVEGGLVTPVIRGADRKQLSEISGEVRSLAKSAREGRLLPEDYQGGTFTISNLGMYGIKQFDAVINAPQACILAIGQVEERPVIKDGTVTAANIMTVTLSCDHRAVDGAVGAKFLAMVKHFLQEPLSMLMF